MKVSGVLGGLLMLFVSVSAELSVTCTESWLHVRIRRTPIIHNLQPQHNELYLGSGCPVNIIETDFFEFLYLLSLCDIRVNEYPLAILIESSITYEPMDLDFTGHIPISCYIQRVFPITFVMKRRDDDKRECKRPIGQKCSLSLKLNAWESIQKHHLGIFSPS